MNDAFYVSTTCFQILCSLSLYIIMGSCQSDVTLNCFQYVSKECIKTWACGSFFAANRLVMASIQKSFEGQKMHRYVKRSFTLNLQSIGSLFSRFRYFKQQDYVHDKNDIELYLSIIKFIEVVWWGYFGNVIRMWCYLHIQLQTHFVCLSFSLMFT